MKHVIEQMQYRIAVIYETLSIITDFFAYQGKAAAIPYYEKGILALTQGIDIYIPVSV